MIPGEATKSINQVTLKGKPAENGNGPALVLMGGILLFAAGLRLWSASGDLWVDEIWSLDNVVLARARADAGDWLALFFHDNTHALNTAYLVLADALAGAYAHPFVYRALSVVTGIATVGLAAAIGWRRDARQGLVTAALVGFSYPMIHFAGEARGYAPMLLAALAAYALLERHLQTPSPGRAAGFVIACLLGLAAHLTFAAVLAGLGLWAAVVLFQTNEPPVRTVARLCLLFGLQIIAVTFYGALAFNNLIIGGGAMVPALDALGDMAELTFGADPQWRGSVTMAIALGLGGAVWWLRRQGDSAWMLFAFVVLAFPLGMVVLDPTHGLTPRYFIASALFALIVAGRGLGALLADRPRPRAVAMVVLALVLGGNGLAMAKFFPDGRGRYADATAFLAGTSPSPARYAGYHPFSIETVTAYHARKNGHAAAIRFAGPKEDARDPAQWFIGGHLTGRPPPPEITRAVGGGLKRYQLRKVFPHWGISGDTWAIYRRAE